MTLNVLQVSDCHLVVPGAKLIGVDTQDSLEAVLAQAVAEQAPDAVIASGDLAHDPTRDVYSRFLDTIRRYSDSPLMCLPGNHDVLGVMQAAGLPLAPLQLGAWSAVPFDSHEDDKPRALVNAADRAQVAAHLAAAGGEHCLIATHHHMIEVNCPWLDCDMIQNGQELIEWLSECSVRDGASRLRSVVFGHVHQIVDATCGSVPVHGVPSTCFQFLPRSEKFAVDTVSPGYRWLTLADDGGMTTHVRRVDSFPIDVQLNA